MPAKAATAKSDSTLARRARRALGGVTPPRSYHLDRRAASLIEDGAGDGDDLLDTTQLALWFGMSSEWFEMARSRGYGPPFIRVTPRRIRYRRSDVIDWLRSRTIEPANRRCEKTPTDHAPEKADRVRGGRAR